MNKLKIGIIGTGNIGTDLLMKIRKSERLECTLFMGRREESSGIKLAERMGIRTSTKSLNELIENPYLCDVVCDATSAKVHIENSKVLKKLGIFTIDMTPARIGKMCVPAANLDDCVNGKIDNVNMVTCGGQGTIPIIYAIKSVQQNIDYTEIVASIASRSAGIGTRNNIDEFTQTTKDAIVEICGLKMAKAIITLNPAEPPVYMHNTIFMTIKNPDMPVIRQSVKKMEKEVQRYVPGYEVILEPTYENGRVTTMIQVTGAGDYLPEYAGNLDIITSAAIRVAEKYADMQDIRG